MQTTHKNIIALTISTLLMAFTAPSQANGILVFDPTAKAEMVKQWGEEVEQWNSTVDHYRSQLGAYADQLATATGVRDIGAFTNQLSDLKGELEQVYQKGNSYLGDFAKNPSGALSGEAQTLFDKYGAFDMCKAGVEAKDNLCKARVVSMAANIEQGNTINEQLSEAMSEIDDLSGRVELAEDSKESQDLANALTAQSLKMQAIKAQYDVWLSKNQADEKVYAEQQKAQFRQQQANAPIPTFN